MYYSVAIFRERQQSILAVLGQEVPRDIILFLIESPGATQIDIARHKSLTPPTINWHMSRLIEIGLVSRRKKGKFVKYYTQGRYGGYHQYFKDILSVPLEQVV